VRVVEPGRDRDGVVRVEDVGRGRVVDDDRVLHRATELREVLSRVERSGRQECATSHTPRFLTKRERSEKEKPPTHLNVVPLVVVAALPEQPVLHNAVDVELVENGVGVLAERSGKDDNFVDLAHRSEELCER
jgi:hypothetical protein